MLKQHVLAGVCSLILLTAASGATANDAVLPDDHAPIGVMADHTHKQGEWMASYRYSRMEMNGNRDGNSGVSASAVLNNFIVAPLDMSMEMHMFGLMYGANEKLTLMAMAPYVRKSMNHVNRMGVHFNTETQGIGDLKFSGIYTLYDSGVDANTHRTEQTLTLNLGASLPTGSINERGNTPAGTNQKLPYPMQLGSGTLDPLLGLTFVNKFENWSWGAQAGSVLRFGKNHDGYRLGNEYSATSWVAHDVNRFASLSLRLDGKSWGNIHGHDNELNVAMVPTARTDMRGGERVDALIGLNLYQPEGVLAGHRLALEFGMPVYQRLDGPQLETDYRFTIGWQRAF